MYDNSLDSSPFGSVFVFDFAIGLDVNLNLKGRKAVVGISRKPSV